MGQGLCFGPPCTTLLVSADDAPAWWVLHSVPDHRYHVFVESNLPKNVSWYSGGFFLLPLIPGNLEVYSGSTATAVWYLPSGRQLMCGVSQVDWAELLICVWWFARSLNCWLFWQQRLESPQKTISTQVHFPCVLITSLFSNLWWVVG